MTVRRGLAVFVGALLLAFAALAIRSGYEDAKDTYRIQGMMAALRLYGQTSLSQEQIKTWLHDLAGIGVSRNQAREILCIWEDDRRILTATRVSTSKAATSTAVRDQRDPIIANETALRGVLISIDPNTSPTLPRVDACP